MPPAAPGRRRAGRDAILSRSREGRGGNRRGRRRVEAGKRRVGIGFQLAVGGLGGVEPDGRWIYLLGVSESLDALVLALAACALSALLLSAGGFRSLRGGATG